MLGLCVSELLARSHPDADEGALTRMRSALVNAEALARWARTKAIGDALALGKGARSGSEREQTNVLADAVEALVASVYEARGLEGARKLVEHVVREPMQEAAHLGSRDPKSLLQEQVQARGLAAPTYRVKEHARPAARPDVRGRGARSGADVLGVGEGRSKRVAERAAALAALDAEQPSAARREAGRRRRLAQTRARYGGGRPRRRDAEGRGPRRTGGAR